MKTKEEIEKKIWWPKVRDIIYLQVLRWWWDITICFRLLLMYFIIPCSYCARHWLYNMLKFMLFIMINKFIDITSYIPNWLYCWWVIRFNVIAFAQQNILKEQWYDVKREWIHILMYIKEEWWVEEKFLIDYI